MAASRGPKIITEDLVLYLDGANPKSALSDSSAWNDISGNNIPITKYNSPNVVTLGGTRCFELNSTGDRFTANFGGNISTNNLTFEAWIYPAATELTSGDRGAIIQGYAYLSWNKSNRRMSSYWYSTNNRGYHEPSTQMARETWNHMVGTWNSSTGELYQYINGVLSNTVTTVATSGFYYQTINIGWEGNGRQFAGGLGLIKIYNNFLSTTQVQNLYNNTKSRFGR